MKPLEQASWLSKHMLKQRMKTEKYEDRFLLTLLVLSDSKFSEEAIFCAKAADRLVQVSFKLILQYDSGVRECAETNYDSNGVLL